MTCHQMDRQPSLIPTVALPIHTHVRPPCTAPRHHDPEGHGQRATRRVTCADHSHPAHSPGARHAHCHSENCWAFWIPDPRVPFHFCNSSPDSAPVLSASSPQTPGELKLPGCATGKSSLQRSCLLAGFVSPDQHQKHRTSLEAEGSPKPTLSIPFPSFFLRTDFSTLRPHRQNWTNPSHTHTHLKSLQIKPNLLPPLPRYLPETASGTSQKRCLPCAKAPGKSPSSSKCPTPQKKEVPLSPSLLQTEVRSGSPHRWSQGSGLPGPSQRHSLAAQDPFPLQT